MQDRQHAQSHFVQKQLPKIIIAGTFLLFLATLNHWVTYASLPFVSKVAGWDWSLPQHAPLFFTLTFPIRWLPAAWQPIALNIFSALCSALILGLLARSVMLLPHDRTHEQRQRERSEFSLLSIRLAWVPPLLAALVCGLQLTFWENAAAATNESLDLLLFAYAIRCLLEFRISQRVSWLNRLAFIYGLGVTNNWALIGFFPCFLGALIWIRGARFFEFAFITRLVGLGLLGLLLYLLLPALWALKGQGDAGFWEVLRGTLVAQKTMLLNLPGMRGRVLILSLTSILPVIIMGIRWPSTFGDTSAAGAAMTNWMFRLIHIIFLTACLYVAFDPQFSPRALGRGMVPFLSFYYLGALAIGYFSGYVLLVFGEHKGKSWHRPSAGAIFLGRVLRAAVLLTLIAVPAGLFYKNYPRLKTNNGDILNQISALTAEALPTKGAVVLSDDPAALVLLEGYLRTQGKERNPASYLLLHSHSLSSPKYHAQLRTRYPERFPDVTKDLPAGETLDDAALLKLLLDLSGANDIYYLHPSFGYYFERFYPQASGLVYKLAQYAPSEIYPPAPAPAELETNSQFWNRINPSLISLQQGIKEETLDGLYARRFYSRALNFWGVNLQRDQKLEEAGKFFSQARDLNTNNVPALLNLEVNRALRTGEGRSEIFGRRLEDLFGEKYRSWEPILSDNGPFDHPEFCAQLGAIFLQRTLYRQSAIQLNRVQTLDPNNVAAKISLGNVFLQGQLPDRALEEVAKIRKAHPANTLHLDAELDLIRLEAAALHSKGNFEAAEKLLAEAHQKHPNVLNVLDTLVQLYTLLGRHDTALATLDKMLSVAPESPELLLTQANIHITTKDYSAAKQSLEKVLKKTPEHVQALLYRIFINVQEKNHQAAREDVAKILKGNAKNVDALLYQAVIHIEEKEFAKAIEPLDQVLELQPSNWNALRNRAIAHLKTGDLNAAQKDYQTLRKLVPKFFVAYYGLAEVAFQRKDAAEAIRNYELYLQLVPEVDTPEMKAEKQLVLDRLAQLKTPRN